jgi:hypothetical protein
LATYPSLVASALKQMLNDYLSQTLQIGMLSVMANESIWTLVEPYQLVLEIINSNYYLWTTILVILQFLSCNTNQKPSSISKNSKQPLNLFKTQKSHTFDVITLQSSSEATSRDIPKKKGLPTK